MESKHNKLVAEAAWVTPEGILFNGQYYSCKRAIRDGWYGQALARNPWMVRVLHDPAAGQDGSVYIESEQLETENVCYIIRNTADYADTNLYQAKMRKLLKERKQLLGESPSI